MTEQAMKTVKLTSNQMSTASLALTMLLASLGVSIPNVALPFIAKNFNADFSEAQLIIIGYLLAVTVLIVTAAKLGDIFGRRRVLLVGIVLFSGAAMASGVAQNLWIIIFSRVIQGVGAAILMSMSIALISDSIPKEKTGSAMGLMGTMSAVGTASGPSLGGFLINSYGWRSVFFLMAFVGISSFIIAKRYIRTTENKPNTFSIKDIDVVGMLILGFALSTYSIGVTLNGGHLTEVNWALIVVSAISIFAFLKFERNKQNPLLRLNLFNRALSSNLFMNVIVSTVMMSTLIVGPFYLSKAAGLTPLIVGAVMSVGPLLSIISGIPAGKAVDKIGAKSITKIGLSLMALGTISLCISPLLFGIKGYIFSILFLSPGYQLFQASNNTSVMDNISEKERGVVSGLLSLSRNIGLISGASVMGAVFSFSTGIKEISSASASALSRGMECTFLVATVLLLIAITIAIFNNKPTKRKEIYEQ